VLYPENFEEKIGFDKIREKIRYQCLSDLGKEKVDQIKFSTSPRFIRLLIDQVDEFREIIDMEDSLPLEHCFNIKNALEKIRIEGTYMEREEVYNLRLNQSTIKNITGFLKKRYKEDKYHKLHHLARDVKTYPFIIERIDQILTSKGEIKDNASSALKRIRQEIKDKESSVSTRTGRIFKQLKQQGVVAEDSSLAIREGRAVIPVDARLKRKINGVVQDESASGKTVYIEPSEIVELNNQLKELRYDEKREIIQILRDFAGDIRPYLDDLLHANDFLGKIDFIRAKALFSREINAIKPAIVNKPHLRWYQAIHPILYLNFKKENREVVPLDLELDNKNQRILVISGPNAGGKSVCLTTTGLIQYMFQCGLLVPLKSGSEMGIFRKLFINIGDDQSIENDLSTYSSHLLNMKNFVRYAESGSLILIDEFGAGTEPVLGGAIAEAILDSLNKKRVMGIITTHYSNLKHFASSVEGIENGAMLFDTDKMSPLYKLTIGEPGSSFAFEIAKKIGLPQNVLDQASKKVGKKHINFDKNLKDIIRDKRYWEQKRESVKEKEKRLERVLNEYSESLQKAKKMQKEVKKKAEEDARELLNNVNKKIENTIRQIKESNAEKEKTRQIRNDFEEFKNKNLQPQEDEELNKKMKALEKEQKNLSQELNIQTVEHQKNAEQEEEGKLKKGDKVKWKERDTAGEIMDLNEDSALVGFGNILTTIEYDQLEKITEEEYKKQTKTSGDKTRSTNFDLGKRKMEFHPEIDVRGKRAEEALQEVKDFIDEAIVINMDRVRILHGKGNGILRQLIRNYLSTVDMVRSYSDEHLEYGGSGITVVEFDR
jgi:DNA mismatch repair protein MutS2